MEGLAVIIAGTVYPPLMMVRQNALISLTILLLAFFAFRLWKTNKSLSVFFAMATVGYSSKEFTLFVLAMFFLVTIVQTEGNILNWICIISIISCLVAFAQMFGLDWPYRFRSGFSFTGLTGNINFHSALLAASIPAFLREKWKWCLLVIVPGLVLCKVSGGVYAVCAAFFVYYLSKGNKLSLMAIPLIVTYAFYDKPGLERYAEWASIDFDLIGDGFGSYKALGGWGHAHNEYVQMLKEIGIVFIIPLSMFIFKFVKTFKKVSIQTNLGIMVIAFNSFVNANFHIAQTALVGLLWIAQYEKELLPRNICREVQCPLQ
jgi:hypothetical protein